MTLLFLIVFFYAVVISIFHFWKNPLPWPDRGGFVFACPSEKAQLAVISALDYFGLKPRFRVDTALAKRAIFWNGLIVNVPNYDLLPPVAREIKGGFVVVSTDPYHDAKLAREVLERRGFSSLVVSEPDPDLPRGSLMLLESVAFPGLTIVFRLPISKMHRPQKWQ